ncbi:MAG: hypothetical protein RIE73_00850 [Coleofasciculus sp. C1-SOL-03]|uniref:hypothetical protein n=1 Tax=Coleofasciculus sp. C1-SOL-03 TaxID=3069522 RepID=UPI00330440C8
MSQQGRHLADRGRTFTERLLTLSAHARSIQEITRNPLLLALLCDLFAQEGNVPPDLTVSKLYQRYWQEKIAYSRIDDSHSSVLAITKEQFCLTLAQALFQMSTAKLCESTYRDELGIQFTAPLATAYDDLLSEGVLELLPSGKIHFFHQTLLEYAIAYWLTRHSAQPQRHQLLQSLNASDTSSTPTHWWPIIRQLLTIVETEAEFEQIQNQLDTRDVAAFGTLAFAAASRNRPDALLNLLPTALELGEAYQKRLRLALESAPRQLALELWSAMLTLLQQGGHTTAVNTAKSISGLLARWPDILLSRLDEALNAIAHRTATNAISDRSITDDRSLIGGWLLQQCFPILKQQVNLDALAALRKHYPLLGANSAGEVLALHLAEGVPRDAQHALLDTLLQAPLGRSKTLQDEITHFWYQNN